MAANNEKLNRFVSLLESIFELDKADLDFGIYRILNIRKDKIKKFLAEELPKKVREALESFTADTGGEIKTRVAKIEKQCNDVGVEVSKTNKAEEYFSLKSQLAAGLDMFAVETDVYSALFNFFNRYYDEGDFISKRRYKEGVYAIPYEGEEVKLYWANADQYYIKTAENFRNYTFVDDGKRVHFRLADATTERNNNKEANGSKRVFMLYTENKDNPDVKTVEEINGELVIRFVYDIPADKKVKYVKENIAAISTIITDNFKNWYGILRQLPVKDPKKVITPLEKHLNAYIAKNTFDYFIHKDLRKFLTRELDFFIKNEVIYIEDIDTADWNFADVSFAKARAIKRVGKVIIDFLAQIEEFQKKLWLKKKFVTETNWCITLDRVDESFYPEIIENAAMVAEWKEMYAIDEIGGNLTTGEYTEPLTVDFLRRNRNLVLDTKHFSWEFKERVVAGIENLDEETGGLLVHSENFQALRVLEERYRGQVKCVYIDPPYNTDATPIMYKNGYKDSSWLSLIKDRCIIAKQFMDDDAVFAFAIDDAEERNAHIVLDEIFNENELGTVVVRNNPSGRPVPTGFAISHEYVLFYAKRPELIVSKLEREENVNQRYKETDEQGRYMWELLRKRGSHSEKSDRPKMYYPIYFNGEKFRLPTMEWDDSSNEWINIESPMESEIECWPIDENGILRCWRWGIETTADNLHNLKYKMNGVATVYYKYRPPEGVTPTTNWIDAKYSSTEHGTGLLKKLFSEYQTFSFPKSLYAVEDSLKIANLLQRDITLDYFAGSGTTAHAVLNLNRSDKGTRKYILVEMGEYFNTVTLPRMKKVIYSADWKNGKPKNRDTGISHVMKYFTLESYEDALSNITLNDKMHELFDRLGNDYMINYMLDTEAKGSILNIDAFTEPFRYTLRINENNEIKEKVVDICETFNYLLGLSVVRQSVTERFRTVPDPNDEYEKSVGLERDKDGGYAFKQIEGRLPDDRRALVIWRTVSDDLSQSNAALDAYFLRHRINPTDRAFDVIYINGGNNLENLRADDENWMVQIIEPIFKVKMFEGTE